MIYLHPAVHAAVINDSDLCQMIDAAGLDLDTDPEMDEDDVRVDGVAPLSVLALIAEVASQVAEADEGDEE